MVELVPFGKYQGKSVEQVALEDPDYFYGHLMGIEIRKPSLRNRLWFVDHVANQFVSQVRCNGEGCENPAEVISIYHNENMNVRQSDTGFVYCSQECYTHDSKADKGPKIGLFRLGLGSCICPVKRDTKRLVKVLEECMGVGGRRLTQDFLYNFFNNCSLRVQYGGPRN